MYQFQFATSETGVPKLYHRDIERIAEIIINDFNSELLVHPGPIDVERLAEYLNLDIDYLYLSNNGAYDGMAVFKHTDRLPYYNADLKIPEYTEANANTIIIDSRLTEGHEHKYRSSVTHEIFHQVAHRTYFLNSKNKDLPYSDIHTGNAMKRNSQVYKHKAGEKYTDIEIVEMQANSGGAAFLINRSSASYFLKDYLNGELFKPIDEAICGLSKVYNVSPELAKYRLINLGFASKDQKLVLASVLPLY